MNVELITTMNQREILILELIAEGCNIKEVSVAMETDMYKMHREVNKLRYKMGAKNMAHMVFIACKKNLSTKFLVA